MEHYRDFRARVMGLLIWEKMLENRVDGTPRTNTRGAAREQIMRAFVFRRWSSLNWSLLRPPRCVLVGPVNANSTVLRRMTSVSSSRLHEAFAEQHRAFSSPAIEWSRRQHRLRRSQRNEHGAMASERSGISLK